ncbi:hypothetical protein CHS0354_019421 [Potamilus streckersoni]|uniref:Uncharacterized protein n=1 Tax=Potamilus streckersoni TaxID=2493646 RepID=A0AAE0SIK5_9BIVA|nr:hypothetical protein CHS0354_019421 [Potamilus streckersoni]
MQRLLKGTSNWKIALLPYEGGVLRRIKEHVALDWEMQEVGRQDGGRVESDDRFSEEPCDADYNF